MISQTSYFRFVTKHYNYKLWKFKEDFRKCMRVIPLDLYNFPCADE